MNIPDPFQYFDFRVWFREVLVAYSYSQVIVKLGLKSKGHITQILQGKKNVTPQLAEKIADLTFLQGRSRQFLFALIEYTQAKNHEQKKISLDKMNSLQIEEGKTLSPSHYDLCKHWYYPVIRELIRITPIEDSYEEIAKKISPSISERSAETAVKDLERMGLIVRINKKQYAQTDTIITYGEGWKSTMIREFQLQALELQKKALDSFSAEEREISNATICVSEERAKLIKERLKEFRHEIMGLVRSDTKNSEQVFQLNLGFFPLSKATKK